MQSNQAFPLRSKTVFWSADKMLPGWLNSPGRPSAVSGAGTGVVPTPEALMLPPDHVWPPSWVAHAAQVMVPDGPGARPVLDDSVSYWLEPTMRLAPLAGLTATDSSASAAVVVLDT